MESFGEFVLLFLQQFAGGPGPVENNLVRFGLAAILWLALFVIAWSRQRNQNLPRERLLVVGFGLAFAREFLMFALITGKIVGWEFLESENIYHHPLEHALEMAAIIVVAGAYLRYALDDERISRRYLQVGIGTTVVAAIVVLITWPRFAVAYPEIQFHHTWQAWVFHVPLSLMIAGAMMILARKRGWLRNVVILAMSFFFISEFLILVNFATYHSYSQVICPIGNSLHILAIPLLGFVYLKEQSVEKRRAEEELAAYHDQLENLVEERTSMLVAQNEIAGSLSQSLDLETILNMALDKVLSVLSMEVGLIFLLDREGKGISLGTYRGRLSQDDLDICIKEECPYLRLSKNAIDKQAIIQTRTDETLSGYAHIRRERIQLLISVPLISKENIVGVLTLGTKKSDPLDQTNLELLTAICHQVGMAIENAYLYQESELWASELSMLHKASINLGSTLDTDQINEEIAYQSARLTGRQMACVLYWDEHCEKFKIVSSVGMKPEVESFLIKNPTACDLFDELCKTRKSIVIDDIQRDALIPESWKTGLDIHSLFCSPIWGIDEPVEFLFIMDQRETKSWRSKDVELVESFVSRAAVALENAKLYGQLEWAATLEERQRIAAEMHDGLAQTISLLGLKVDNASELLPSESNSELVEALKGVRETVSQASVDARKSISSLQTMPQPRKSLQDILTSLVEQCSDGWSNDGAFVFHTSFSFSEPLFLSQRQITQVVPIIQEAIINAQKHSNATQIQIQGQQSNGQVCITIEDDGKGFDMDNLSDKQDNHFGIKIMRARAARFGGKLQIISNPGHGTIVTLSWMLNRKREGALRNPAHTRSPAVESETTYA